jgi:hypothetical protein
VCAEHRCTGLNCEACWKFQLPTLTRVIAHRHTQFSPTYMIMPMCVCLCLCFVSVSRSRRSGDRRRTAGEKFWKSLRIHFILGMLAQLTFEKGCSCDCTFATVH